MFLEDYLANLASTLQPSGGRIQLGNTESAMTAGFVSDGPSVVPVLFVWDGSRFVLAEAKTP
jgi:hypothetical protein